MQERRRLDTYDDPKTAISDKPELEVNELTLMTVNNKVFEFRVAKVTIKALPSLTSEGTATVDPSSNVNSPAVM